MQGLSAIFIRTEIAIAADPDQVQYLDAHNEAMASQRPPDFRNVHILRGYERFITLNHELRHFHDALLCLPLFKLFLIQNGRLWRVMQLPEQIEGLNESQLPLMPFKSGQAKINAHGHRIIASIHHAESAFHNQHRLLFAPRTCLGKLTISLSHVLEANAITTELLHLIVVHGIESTAEYYERIIRYLPSVYSDLINAFVSLSKDLESAIVALHMSASIALYLAEDPVELFCTVTEEFAARPGAFFDRYNPELIAGWFSETESKVEAFARGHRLISATGESIVAGDGDEDWYKEQLRFHDLVYDARKLLITKYIHEFKMDARNYFQRTTELPLPPIVFWPGEVGRAVEVMTVSEELLGRAFGDVKDDCYVIRGGPSSDGPVVVAGILPYFGHKPFVAPPVIDMQMLAHYWFLSLFSSETGEVYSSTIDEVYEDLLYRSFGVSIRPRTAMSDWT